MIKKYLIKTFVLYIISIISITQTAYAQPDISWTKTFGGSETEWGYSVQQTSDGGYILIGETHSFGIDPADFWLIKTNALGDTIWTRTYGGSCNDGGFSVHQTLDGGYIISGFIGTYGSGEETGRRDVWLIKTDTSGDTIWTKTFGGSDGDEGWSLQQTSDGGYIIGGITNFSDDILGDIWLIKTNEFGDTLWTKTFGGIEVDWCQSVQQTNDEGYIIIGRTRSYGAGDWDVWLIKTDVSGDTMWTKTFGGSGHDEGYSVQQTSEGGYIIAGTVYSHEQGNVDIWLIKTNASGDTLWTRAFGGNGEEYGLSVDQTFDNGYIITGVTNSYGEGGFDVFIIKTDESGDTLWTRTFGGSDDDRGASVRQVCDGGYIIIGDTKSFGAGSRDILLIRVAQDTGQDTTPPQISVLLDPDLLWPPNHQMVLITADVTAEDNCDENPVVILTSVTSNEPDDAPGSGDGNTTNDIQEADTGTVDFEFYLRAERDGQGDGRIYTVIYTATDSSGNSSEGVGEVFVPHDNADNCATFDGGNQPNTFELYQCYPNPFNPSTRISYSLSNSGFITLKVYDIIGREIETLVNKFQKAGNYSFNFDASKFSGGIYFYGLQVGNNFAKTKKMLLMR